jgi:murein DD-endopeptidase MepM/ murein hydrolase activator NlpD
MGVIFILLVCITFLIIHYFSQISNIYTIRQKDRFIQSLEKENKDNLKIIDSFNRQIDNNNKNGSVIKNKLKEIQQLEDIIKGKLNKSISFKSGNSDNINSINANMNDEGLIKVMETKIVDLNEIDKRIDILLYKEQFIPSILPCKGYITSYFGYRKNPFNEIQSEYHRGIDIACGYGTKICATASGTVTIASYSSGYGNEVAIYHGNGIQTIYGHNSKLCVHTGQVVKKGDLIALSGSTGSSTGPHSHFEIRKNNIAIDPNLFFKKGGA